MWPGSLIGQSWQQSQDMANAHNQMETINKWVALKLLSRRQGGFIQPGEVIELDNEHAGLLLEMDAIRPVEMEQENKSWRKRQMHSQELPTP